jgi:hypothetical protein
MCELATVMQEMGSGTSIAPMEALSQYPSEQEQIAAYLAKNGLVPWTGLSASPEAHALTFVSDCCVRAYH